MSISVFYDTVCLYLWSKEIYHKHHEILFNLSIHGSIGLSVCSYVVPFFFAKPMINFILTKYIPKSSRYFERLWLFPRLNLGRKRGSTITKTCCIVPSTVRPERISRFAVFLGEFIRSLHFAVLHLYTLHFFFFIKPSQRVAST